MIREVLVIVTANAALLFVSRALIRRDARDERRATEIKQLGNLKRAAVKCERQGWTPLRFAWDGPDATLLIVKPGEAFTLRAKPQ